MIINIIVVFVVVVVVIVTIVVIVIILIISTYCLINLLCYCYFTVCFVRIIATMTMIS